MAIIIVQYWKCFGVLINGHVHFVGGVMVSIYLSIFIIYTLNYVMPLDAREAFVTLNYQYRA